MKRYLVSLLLAAALLTGAALATAGETRRATFVVHCYDVGVHALEREPGVISVERDWKGFDEVNHVEYDPERISLEELEKALRYHNTYVETLREGKE